MEPVDAIREALEASRVRCGAGRLVLIDGLTAAGKSTVADSLARALDPSGASVRVLHTDRMLHGWRGLTSLDRTLAALVESWSRGESGCWRAWDWHADAWASTHQETAPAEHEVVILEGVGAAAGPHRRTAAVTVWMETSPTAQQERWQLRGDDAEYLAQWQLDEQALHRRWGTREHADLVIGT